MNTHETTERDWDRSSTHIADMVHKRIELLNQLDELEEDVILECVEKKIPVVSINWTKLERIVG